MDTRKNNPIIWADFPDLDVIRVDDTYYMISTTMHLMPGGVILRSYDLIHWEFLPMEDHIYSQDRYTACPVIRYYDGYYYMIYLELMEHCFRLIPFIW